MTYLQPITFYAILRDMPDKHNTEIAEHPDGAMKAYASKSQADTALALMKSNGNWRVDEILMVPPPMTAAYKHAEIKREVAAVKGSR